MRLSEWRGRTPHRDSMSSKVVAVIEPMLASMGAGPDPSCWVVWGDDPAARYAILVPTDAGLLQVHVRVLVPQEGPRASGKLVRWNRVQLGELAMEIAGGHRLISFQVESHVLRGSDEDADAIAAFGLMLFAAIDGRAYRVDATPGERERAPSGPPPASEQAADELPRLPPPSGG